MTGNFTEVDIQTQQTLEEVDFTAPGQLVLAEIERSLAARDITEVSHWKRAHYKAVMNWLTKYKPKPDATNLEKVRGYLEAFHHCCEVEDWGKASEILCIAIDTPTNEGLHAQLGTWGYYREQTELYSKILARLDTNVDIICLKGLGNAYDSIGDYHQAIHYHQQVLVLAQEIEDRQREAGALGNLGNAYDSLGNYNQAIDYHQKCLAIMQAIDDRAGVGKALGNLGNAYNSLGDYRQAIDYHQKDLAITQEIGDRAGVGKVLGNLGNAYNSLGDYHQAIDYYQHSLTIAREIGDRAGEGVSLNGLGNVYISLREYFLAINYHQQNLVIAREIDDRAGVGRALSSLGATLIELEKYSQALENLQAALEIFRKISYRLAEAITLYHLAKLHQNLGHRSLALEDCDKAWEIATELDIPLVKWCQELKIRLLRKNAVAYLSLGNYSEVVKCCQQSLTIARESQDRRTEEQILVNLGKAFCGLRNYDKALEYNQQHLELVQATLQQMRRSHYN